MKKILFTLVLTLATAGVFAQLAVGPHYNVTILSGTYQNIEEGTSLDQGVVWDDPTWSIPFPFTFYTFNDTINTLYVGEFGTTVYGVQDDLLIDIFLIYYEDIINADYNLLVSPVSYTTIGPPGNQILIVEWQNVGFYEDGITNGSFNNRTNFQLWFYQNGGIFEYHYGPNSITNFNLMHPEGGVIAGFIENLNSATGQDWSGFHTLSGTPESATVTDLLPTDFLNFGGFPPNSLLNAEPSDGLIYRFEPTFSSVSELIPDDFHVFPNPCQDQLLIHYTGNEQTTAQIFDVQGKCIGTFAVQPGSQQYSTAQLASGLYIIKINEESISVAKQ
jgi:Secretion system C-terminal sorting domain